MSERRPMRVNLPARAATAESRRAKTRERLLDAAMAVIGEKGPERTSIEDLVSAAGVSRGTFYNYFPTTDDLLHALNTRLADGLDVALEPVRTGSSDPARIIAAIVHRMMAGLTSDPLRGWLALRIDGSKAPRPPIFEARFNALYAAGVAQKRFVPADLSAARNLLFGGFRMAQRDILLGETGPDHLVGLVALVLTAYGMDRDEAYQISASEAQAARS